MIFGQGARTRAHLVCSILVSLGNSSTAQVVPKHVTYLRAPASINARAEATLVAAFRGPNEFRVAGTFRGTDVGPLKIGPFISGVLFRTTAIKPAEFGVLDLSITLTRDMVPVFKGIVAENSAQRIAVDRFLDRVLPHDPRAAVRALTPSEMSLIWHFIGWDIKEPVFAVEAAGRTLVVDFDDAGDAVTWLEELSAPCFETRSQESGKMPCYCAVTQEQKADYAVAFSKQEGDVPCAIAVARDKTVGYKTLEIVLYQPEAEMERRVSPKPLADYTKAAEKVLEAFFGDTQLARRIDVVLAVRPGGRSKAWLVPDSAAGSAPEARKLVRALEGVPSPTVKGGPIVIGIRGSIAAPTLSPEDKESLPTPREWLDALAKLGKKGSDTEALLDLVWPALEP